MKAQDRHFHCFTCAVDDRALTTATVEHPDRRSAVEFILTIDIAGSALTDDPEQEVARILREQADALSAFAVTLDAGAERSLRDVNGNRVGAWSVA